MRSEPSCAALICLLTNLSVRRRVLHVDIKDHKSPTVLQTAHFQERRIAIRKTIQHFRELQIVYMPGLRSVLQDPSVLDDSAEALVEGIRLHFPSELPSADRDQACANGFADIEARVRLADTSEALDDLRRHLRTRTYLNKWRGKNVSGQHRGTRARAVQHRIDVKVHAAKTRYRHSRKALFALQGAGTWELTLQLLRDEDVRALNERELTDREKEERDFRICHGHYSADDSREGVVVQGALGEGRRKLSWIWMTVSGEENSAEMHEGE